MDTELSKLRRFALGVGAVLWAYVLAGGTVGELAQVPTLGLNLKFTRPTVIEWGLVLICLYGALRYGYHALVKSLTPWRARQLLETGQFGPMPLPPSNQSIEVKEIASRYLPGMEDQASVVKRITQDYGLIGVSGAGKYPAKVRIWIRIDNLDYTAPIWLNGLAIVAFLISRAI